MIWSSNVENERPNEPTDPVAYAEADRKTLKRFALWMLLWGLLGATFLVFSIWVDWT